MTATERVRAGLIAGAVAVSAVSCLAGALTGSVMLAGLAAAAALLAGGTLAHGLLGRSPGPGLLVEDAVERAETGRKLVIYERETGAFAHWYVQLRCDEECARAKRYERPLTFVLVEPAVGTEPWEVQERLSQWLKSELRATDVVGYSGNGRFVVLMTETPLERAQEVADRLRNSVAGIDIGLASSPRDGEDFEELSAAARIDLLANAEAAA